jgi:hypothetical protein
VVEDTVAQCNMQLEVLAKKIMKNEENVDANKISQWTTEILAVSKNLVTAQAVDESSKAVVAEYVAERSNADTDAAVDDDDELISFVSATVLCVCVFVSVCV